MIAAPVRASVPAAVAGIALVLAPAAVAREGEFVAGPYVEILAECYGAAAEPSARSACIGEASSICIAEEPRGRTEAGRIACIGIEAEAWDTVLEGELQLTAEWARAADRSAPPADPDHPLRSPTLRAAQSAWETYFETECRFAFARSGPVAAAACRLDMIAARAVALNAARVQ